MEVEAYCFFAERRERRQPRRYRRHVTEDEEVDFWSERQFIDRYRVSKDIYRYLLPRWKACPWSNKTRRGYAAEPGVQLLEGLRWYANGPVLRDLGDNYRFEKSTMSRTVRKVTQFLNTLVDEQIYMPLSRQELHATAERFYGLASFPGVIGCIDGTHVLLKAPKDEEDYFVDRKFNHSLSVQVICDRDLLILDINPTFPGSTHDSYMLKKSGVYKLFEEGRYGKYVLLGDSGYPCRRWLMTPHKDPVTPSPESRFNTAQMVTRCCVERCIGVLKSRFRCLSKATGELLNSPEEVTRIVCACAVLHNLCIRARLEDPEMLPDEEYESDEEEDEHEVREDTPEGEAKLTLGRDVRKKITRDHFLKRKRTAQL